MTAHTHPPPDEHEPADTPPLRAVPGTRITSPHPAPGADTENALLGALILNPAELDRIPWLTAQHFAEPRNTAIAQALIDLHHDGYADPVLLAAELYDRGHQDPAVGPYLHSLIEACPGASTASYYADLVHRDHRRHVLAQAATRLAQQAQTDPDGALDDLRHTLDQLDQAAGPHTGQHDPRLVDAGTWLYDQPDTIDAIWGHGDDVLWARGETLIIAGPSGVGKTTIGQQLTLARIGALGDTVLDQPVQPAGKVLYLAMDRPAQARRSLARMVTPDQRALLSERLVVWKGPPPGQIVTNTRTLLDLAHHAGLGPGDAVVVDSIKDVAVGIAKDDVGAAVNTALQELLAADIDVLALHHTRKQDGANGPGREPQSIDEVYGSTWITGGAGSVISIWGAPGDPIVNLKHMKQPAGEVGPWKLRHDQNSGRSFIWHSVDLLDLVRGTGRHGITARAAGVSLFPREDGDPTDSEIEKARRKLERLVRDGLLVGHSDGRGATSQKRYYLAAHEPDDRS